jgi:flagellin
MIGLNSLGGSQGSFLSFARTQSSLSKAFAQLSSGFRINSAADDPAGLAIASNLAASITNISQASRNASDVASALSIADGALTQVQDITGRLQELAMTSANGVYSDEQRQAIQAEYSALTQEIQRIGETTSYNGRQLLDGSTINAAVNPDGSAFVVGGVNLNSLASSLSSQDLGSQAGAQAALSTIQDFSGQLSSQRGASIDSALSRLDSIQSNLQSQRVAQSSAFSQISDADVGSAAADFVRSKVLAQYQSALLSQSTQLQASTLQSLFG